MTINELRLDRDLYRRTSWEKLVKSKDHNNSNSDDNLLYDNLKKRINIIIKDIEDTEFNDIPDIKSEIISALKDIDFYGEIDDKN
jgi:hypothetical protein